MIEVLDTRPAGRRRVEEKDRSRIGHRARAIAAESGGYGARAAGVKRIACSRLLEGRSSGIRNRRRSLMKRYLKEWAGEIDACLKPTPLRT